MMNISPEQQYLLYSRTSTSRNRGEIKKLYRVVLVIDHLRLNY